MPFDPLNPGQMGNSLGSGNQKKTVPGGAPNRRPAAPDGKPKAAPGSAASGPVRRPGMPKAAPGSAASGPVQRPGMPKAAPGSAASGPAQRPGTPKAAPAQKTTSSGPAQRPGTPKAAPARKTASSGQTRRPGTSAAGKPAQQREGPAGRQTAERTGRPPQKSTRRTGAGAFEGKNSGARRPASASGYQPRFAAAKEGNARSLCSRLKISPGLMALIVLMTLGSVIMIGLCVRMVTGPHAPAPQAEIPEIPPLETAAPVIPHVVNTATISVTGDLLPHKTIYSKGSVVYQDEQNYNFDPIFRFLKGYTDAADYAVANLETSLFGPEKPYSGNPKFNTPDQIVDGARNAGFDLLLTANNHCNDTGLPGVLRTVQVIRDRGLQALGTNLDSSEQKFHIQDLNGIRVGMLCYTYEDSQNKNQVTFNYNPLPPESSDLVCSFPLFETAKSREPFYEQVSQQISQMKNLGADAIVIFLHWGKEYHLEADADQKAMAQRLCDLGVDVIVGGHPHVVEPVELLTSTRDPEQKTVCLYSLGNAFSNQRREEMTSQKSGHTEDGMLFHMTFQEYSDGSVHLSHVDVIPTWVDKHADPEGKRVYQILPLENSLRDQWQTLYGLDEQTLEKAAESYSRTMNIVGTGLEASNAWLASQLPDAGETPQGLPAAS